MTDIETAFDTATRVAAGDDQTRYDRVSVILHWTTAALVLVQFILSQIWGWFGRPIHHGMVNAHMSFGVLLTGVIVVRLIWRWTPGHALPPIVAGWMETASRAVHYLLYVLLVSEAALGFATRWSEGKAMMFFGLEIPDPVAAASDAAHHQIQEFHGKVGWAIIIIATGHALAALYHHYKLHDRLLLRMAPRLDRTYHLK